MLQQLIKRVINRIRIEYSFFSKRFDQTIQKNEHINKNYIRKFLPANPVIIDAGAHVGGDSIEMCRLISGSTVHAFEPVPEIFHALKTNTRNYKSIICYPIALSNRDGEQIMHVSSGASDSSSSLLQPKEHLKDHPDVFFNQDITVPTMTLDHWAAEHGISKVDFLWLDMQGFELEVLKSSSVILPTVTAIHMEVSTRVTYEGVPLYPDLKAWLLAKGFRVEVEAIPNGWDFGNILFVRNAN